MSIEWKGPQDGLPPVGIECEIDTRFGWLPGRIVDHGDDYAVAHLHENKHNLKVDWSRTGFRTIQSERDKAVSELEQTIYKDHWIGMPTLKGIAETVWGLGYRKPMSRAEAFDLVVDVASSGDSMTCSECNGERAILSGVTGGPDGPIEHFEECGTCGGQGVLEIDINQILDALGYKD